MRLLHYDRSGKFVLTNFHGKTVPPYAILSHRWEESEVLFADLGCETYEEKAGYRKLEFCAKQAVQDELQYFWIDTCCIDKWNPSERSRAINSMFQWYKNATRCYVFLSDVSISSATESPKQSDWEASFRASEWFARGWTLQELIAPVSVEFFSSEGRRIGDKSSLPQLLEEITAVPQAALQNCALDAFTISERIRWGERRKTTEEEDGIYCLFGILQISMPTCYGEGKKKALERLQTEVEAAGNAPTLLPFPRNEQFVGRESQIAELETSLFSDKQTTTLAAIVGSGGTGKSQLALELAYRTRERNKNRSIFWVDASDTNSLQQSYVTIAQKLNIPGINGGNADVEQLVKFHLADSSARESLMIFDNMDSRDLESDKMITARVADLIDCLPQSRLCSVVFTTTDEDMPKRLATRNVVELQELTPDAALRMLKNYVSTTIPIIEQEEAKLLLKKLLYLPLAIVQAAAYINIQSITLKEYRSRFDIEEQSALEQCDGLSKDATHETDVKDPVATTLLISVDQLLQENSLAIEYLSFAACLNQKDIPLDLLEAASPREKEDAVKVLSRYALVTRRPADSAFDIHRMAHGALRGWLQKYEMLNQWIQYAISRLHQIFPSHDPDNRSKWRRLLPHTKYTLSQDHSETDNRDRLELMWLCASALSEDGRHNEAEELQLPLMKTYKKALGDEHPDTLNIIGNLAVTYRNQRRWKESENLLVQAVESSKRVLGDDHPNTLIRMNHLAVAYMYQNKWEEAEEMELHVMETRKRVLGGEHRETLVSISNHAATYRNRGLWKEAEEMELHVMETRKRVLGGEHPETLNSISTVALSYLNRAQWKEAEELETQVMETRKRVLGVEHPDTLRSMSILASTYWNQGRWKEAEELGVQVTDKEKRVFGVEHANTLPSISNLALVYWRRGELEKAEELGVRVLEGRKRVLGKENLETLTSMSNLALTYQSQGRWKEAEDLEMQAIAIRTKVFGREHPETLQSYNNLALTLESQGRTEEAISLMETCVELRKQVIGNDHSDTKESVEYLNQWKMKNTETGS